jgi:drug/metabolite transporter (DMT)-like permease
MQRTFHVALACASLATLNPQANVNAFSSTFKQASVPRVIGRSRSNYHLVEISSFRAVINGKPIPGRINKSVPSYSYLAAVSESGDADANVVTGADSKNVPLPLPERTKGLLVLLTVPFAWGTYSPVVKYLYEIQPAVPGFIFSACYYAVASLTTLSIVAFQERKNNINNTNGELSPMENSSDPGKNAPTFQFPVLGGLELGGYLFIGNCLQVIGLKTVPSDRAGFLVQLTTVMVPVAEALFAGNLFAVPGRTWFSCLLAFSGICVMNLDGIGEGSFASILMAFQSFTPGDTLILFAAVLYTLHVVQLGRYAKETTPMKLAASKATVETFFSAGLVFALMACANPTAAATGGGGLLGFAQETGTEISNFFAAITKGIAAGTVPKSAILSALGATLWTGLVTCAYTIFAQSYGQRRVGPTDANLIYSIQPIYTALFAWFLLGETMGPAGVVGGALIGLAIYLVTSTGNGLDKKTDTPETSPSLTDTEKQERPQIRDSEKVFVDIK